MGPVEAGIASAVPSFRGGRYFSKRLKFEEKFFIAKARLAMVG
jgi:hypothetical protein